MAKLSVVTSDVIEVKGVQYRKVDREVREGDVVQANEDTIDVTYGGFYAVDSVDGGYFTFTDDEGDERARAVGDSEFVVYEKVASQPAAVTAESPELYTHESVQYRKVKRKAAVGERVLIVDNNNSHGYKVGEVVIGKSRYDWGGSKVGIETGEAHGQVRDTDYIVLEPVNSESPRRLTVGDYAKVVGNFNCSNYTVGSVVKITLDDGTDWAPYKAKKIDGTVGNWLCIDDVEPATEADFLAQYDNITQDGVMYRRAKEGEKPTHFIRKPSAQIRKMVLPDKVYKITAVDSDGDYVCKGERGYHTVSVIESSIGMVVAEPTLKVGDSVKLTIADGDKPHFGWGCVKNGAIGIVAEISEYRVVVDFPAQRKWNAKPAELTVVSDETAKWAKIGREVGEYKAGDVVQLTRDTGSHYYRSGSIAILDSVNGDGVGFGGGYGGHTSWLKLVAPVEQRFDIVESTEVSAE